MDMGGNIKRYRKMHHMTQGKLAEKLPAEGAVRHYEKRHTCR